jgi:hypothetical protein
VPALQMPDGLSAELRALPSIGTAMVELRAALWLQPL